MILLRRIEAARDRLPWIALLTAALAASAAFAQAPATKKTATRDDTMPDAAELAAFIAKQEKAMEAARKKMLSRIDARAKAVRKSKLDANDARRWLTDIERDRKAFTDYGRLPSSDILVDVVVSSLDDYQSIAERIEAFRRHWAEKAVHADDPAAMARLAALEDRLKRISPGRNSFANGSVWAGQRVNLDGFALKLKLQVNDVTGNSFRGELEQTGNFGRPDVMTVEGHLTGNRIAFETTEMILGKNRKLVFRGYVLDDRIVASLGGVSTDGKPIAAGVSLRKNNKSG